MLRSIKTIFKDVRSFHCIFAVTLLEVCAHHRILYLHWQKQKEFCLFQKIIVKVSCNRIAGLLKEVLIN